MPETNEKEPAAVVAMVADLVFGSRISATAASKGIAVELVRTPDAFRTSVDRLQPKLSIVDLTAVDSPDGSEWVSLREAARSSRLIGFVPHVDIESADAAKRVGFDEVLPRSRFAARLPELLARYIAPEGA